jgi:hypothetical protein
MCLESATLRPLYPRGKTPLSHYTKWRMRSKVSLKVTAVTEITTFRPTRCNDSVIRRLQAYSLQRERFQVRNSHTQSQTTADGIILEQANQNYSTIKQATKYYVQSALPEHNSVVGYLHVCVST